MLLVQNNYKYVNYATVLELPSLESLRILAKHLLDYESFLVGYMNCTIEETMSSMYLIQDYKICVLKMMSLWRCKDVDDSVKSISDLLKSLKPVLDVGPFKIIKSVINGEFVTVKDTALT